VPVPSEVYEFATVGLAEVFQHTPLPVTGVPPSEDIFPPEDADVGVIVLIIVVVNIGKEVFFNGMEEFFLQDERQIRNKIMVTKILIE